MNLKQFKEHISSFPEGTLFEYGISWPFSWRGVYAEVAFKIEKEPMTREQVLAKINDAYINSFRGWKGGDFTYDDHTDVHFEEGCGSYTGGDYTALIISEIEDAPVCMDNEERLIKLAFKS